MTRVAVALVHHPCVDKNGEIFTTSITNLDVHDIARSSRTYGIAAFYVVTPISAQQEMGRAIAAYWEEGRGKDRNPHRKEAMGLVHIVASVEDAIAQEAQVSGTKPIVIATSAKLGARKPLSHPEMRLRLDNAPSALLMFGTGHGLAPSLVDGADFLLEPLPGVDGYNHLSVRSAAAIIIDRLLG
jgi:hypothetical protein